MEGNYEALMLYRRSLSCNWLGGHASVLAMDWFGNETLHNTPFKNITIRGDPVAAVQNVDTFSFAYVIPFVPDLMLLTLRICFA